jgi:FKBP-type peptidyl-prolyl cis-trans isomerase 2
MQIGDAKKITLKPEEAYGPVIQEAFREVDAETVPAQFRFVGAVLGVQDPAGGVFPIRVSQVNEDKIVLDFNHPLAGQTLQFDVKVLNVSENSD